jgi:hypothetical protein
MEVRLLELDSAAGQAQVLGEFVLRDPSLWSVVGVAAHGARSDHLRADLKGPPQSGASGRLLPGMLRRVELANFKAFERFTVHLRGDVFLVGPNNAGKSTLIAALRAVQENLRHEFIRSRRECVWSLMMTPSSSRYG